MQPIPLTGAGAIGALALIVLFEIAMWLAILVVIYIFIAAICIHIKRHRERMRTQVPFRNPGETHAEAIRRRRRENKGVI